MTPAELIAFETGVREDWESGKLPFLIHLCGGNEQQLCEIFEDNVRAGDWVLASHRCHYHALLAGVPAGRVRKLIHDGKSMFIYDRTHRFLCSAVLAGTCGIAAGIAWALKEEQSTNRVWCFLGDGAEEQGHFYEAAMFVEAHELPCAFWIEDNDRQVDTTKQQRRGHIDGGLEQIFRCVKRYTYQPTYPHAGSGCAFHIQFDPARVEQHRWTR